MESDKDSSEKEKLSENSRKEFKRATESKKASPLLIQEGIKDRKIGCKTQNNANQEGADTSQLEKNYHGFVK